MPKRLTPDDLERIRAEVAEAVRNPKPGPNLVLKTMACGHEQLLPEDKEPGIGVCERCRVASMVFRESK